MIKFFRKIRQKLVAENKMGKYFKYAIGEIVLVVIGILIALQVNNWNEHRTAKEKTNKYLQALATEIERNISYLEKISKSAHRDIEASANSLKLLNLPEAKYYSDSVVSSAIYARPITAPTLFNSTYKDLINAGVLENISDVVLKNKILSIEAFIEYLDKTSKEAEDIWLNYHMPYMIKYNNVSNNWDSINKVKIHKPPFKRKREAFVQNFDYANIVTSRMRMMGNFENQLVYTKEYFIDISEAIKKYLNN